MTEREAIEQLAALLDGDGAAEAPPSLGALAGLATAVRDHADVMAPTAEFRSSLRAELVAAAEAPPGLVERARDAWTRRTAHLRTSARVAVATMTASSMIGSAGVAVAAQEALPGELLYGLKHLTEDARLLLAVDGVAEARLHLAFARERLEELRATAGQLDSDRVVALLAEMDTHSESGAGELLEGGPTGVADADEVRRFTNAQRDGLVSVLNELPLPAKPVAEDSLALLRRLEITANGTTASSSDIGDRTHDLDGLLDDIEAGASARTSRDSSSTITDRTGVDVPLTGDEQVLPGEDGDGTRLHGDADDGDEPVSPDADTTEAETEERPEQEPEREQAPLAPSGGLLGPAPGDGDGDEDRDGKTRLDSPISNEEPPHDESRDDETVIDGDGGDLATDLELDPDDVARLLDDL